MVGEEETVLADLEYQKHELVFAKCSNFQPWPGQIIEVFKAKPDNSQEEEVLYRISYFAYYSARATHRVKDLEPFNLKTMKKYQKIYSQINDKNYKSAPRAIEEAHKIYKSQRAKGMVFSHPDVSSSKKKVEKKVLPFDETKNNQVEQKETKQGQNGKALSKKQGKERSYLEKREIKE